MNIQLLSDLHLEANPEFAASPAPEAQVLVLAGDIGSYQTGRDGSVMAEADWGLQRFSPLPQYAGWPVPAIFVPGNHEYDALDVDDAHQRLRDTCERLGIAWLERLVRRFPFAAWLNPIPAEYWERTEGYYTLGLVRKLFPMFELTPEGLEQAVKKLKAR